MSHFSARPAALRGGVAVVLGLTVSSMAAAQTSEAAPAAAPQQVVLSCQGGGTVTASQSGSTSTYNSKTRSYESGTTTTTGKQAFTGMVRVEISGDMGRVALPKPMGTAAQQLLGRLVPDREAGVQ